MTDIQSIGLGLYSLLMLGIGLWFGAYGLHLAINVDWVGMTVTEIESARLFNEDRMETVQRVDRLFQELQDIRESIG